MSSLCDLFEGYLELVDDTESPILYHRWSLITALSSIFNRRIILDFSIGSVYPNMYVILLGPPAARKNTAIDLAVNLIRSAGYTKIASGSTSPEQFLIDLHEGFDNLETLNRLGSNDLEELDLGISTSTSYGNQKVSDVLIAEGELLSFLGHNNTSFSTKLLNLWDNKPFHDVRTISGDKYRIKNPTLSLIGGATPSTFKKIFPYDVTGQGLLSRIILVYGAGPSKKCFDPKPFDKKLYAELQDYVSHLLDFPKRNIHYKFTPSAYEYSKHLYESCSFDILDPRFQYYNGRRDAHYKKLCLIIAATNLHEKIELGDCLLANSILTYTEQFMPSALGEFGLDKTDERTELVYSIIRKHKAGLQLNEILQRTISIVGKPQELTGHIIRLLTTERIDKITNNGRTNYIAIERTVEHNTDLVDYSLLKEYNNNPHFYADTDTETAAMRQNEAELAKEIELIVKEQAVKAKTKKVSGALKAAKALPKTATSGGVMNFSIPKPKP